MSNVEFDKLELDGRNYLTWAMDMKISLSSRGLITAINPPQEGNLPLTDQIKYGALFSMRHRLHLDLKSEYLMDKNPYDLWNSLKERYEQQKAVILPEAQREWSNIRVVSQFLAKPRRNKGK